MSGRNSNRRINNYRASIARQQRRVREKVEQKEETATATTNETANALLGKVNPYLRMLDKIDRDNQRK